MLDVDHIDELDEVLVFLRRQWFGEAVGRHVGGRDPSSGNCSPLNLLPEPTTMNIYMFQTRHKPWYVGLYEAERLFVVAVNDHWLLSIKLNTVEESCPPYHLPGRFR